MKHPIPLPTNIANMRTLAPSAHKTAHEPRVIAMVLLAEDRDDRIRRLLGAVEGDAREQVVHDVVVDDVVEEVATDEAKVAVNGAERAARERPAFVCVVRDVLVCVVEVGDCDWSR
jgi:hypothetical protein